MRRAFKDLLGFKLTAFSLYKQSQLVQISKMGSLSPNIIRNTPQCLRQNIRFISRTRSFSCTATRRKHGISFSIYVSTNRINTRPQDLFHRFHRPHHPSLMPFSRPSAPISSYLRISFVPNATSSIALPCSTIFLAKTQSTSSYRPPYHPHPRNRLLLSHLTDLPTNHQQNRHSTNY